MKKLVLVCFSAALMLGVSGCAKKLSKEEMVERGRYLVNSCGVLKEHTPLKEGKPDMTRFMAGSAVGYRGPWGVYYPKNLTPDSETGIMMLTEEEILSEIKGDGVNQKPSIFSDYYKNLTEDDLRSTMLYLKTLPPIANKIPADLKPGEKCLTAVVDLNPQGKAVVAPAPTPAPAKKIASTKTTSTKKTAASKKAATTAKKKK
ncbi:MAG: cytochrome c [Candidatus Firestonebacteria bacterium]